MQFEFKGNKYRIIFHHDKSRRWSDHLNHSVQLTTNPIGERAAGRIVLWCVNCGIAIGNVPKADWQRKTTCIIQVRVDDRPVQDCWVVFCQAVGRPNHEAGDDFNRAYGRYNSLANALRMARTRMRQDTPAFADAAWDAYLGRGWEKKKSDTEVAHAE